MRVLRAYFSGWYWRHGFSWVKAIAALLSSFGALWLIVEIASFFSAPAREVLPQLWPWFLLLGSVIAFWINKPLLSVSCRLSDRDITLTIGVGDLFKNKGALVVGANTTFDTDTKNNLISSASIQGQYSEKYYNSIDHLDGDITRSLDGVPFELIDDNRVGKKALYPVGTVAKVSGRGRTAYLVAIAAMTAKGTARGSFDDLKTALPELWGYIAEGGSIEPLVMPVLGTGYSRITQTREEVIREIVNSFVAGCSARRFTESLTIVIHPRDFYVNGVDIVELGRYLRHVCKYTQSGQFLRVGAGTEA